MIFLSLVVAKLPTAQRAHARRLGLAGAMVMRLALLASIAWVTTDPNAWLALGTLTLLEIVLGIDNIIFLSLVVAKLPTAQRAHARRLGLAGAMVMRL
ncbi:TerC family protein, partial [Enterobacter hormaechei]|uniref:TerC family protein n=1 Tax=Enterobacter hormaechei TaxID=158836 RepID=UPI003CC5E87B